MPRSTKPESVLAKGPCCVVASSGMLNGGKSINYAKVLIGNSKNLIAITGYQAEGTPGRALWDWAEAGRPTDQMPQLKEQEPVDVKCQVEKYSLSAHADKDELIDLIRKVQPRKLFLVHGDAEARRELFKSVPKVYPAVDVELPKNGQTFPVRKQAGIERGRRWSSDRIISEVSIILDF